MTFAASSRLGSVALTVGSVGTSVPNCAVVRELVVTAWSGLVVTASSATNAQRGTALVTGGSGFIAGHCILRLAAAGYRVRTTVRSLAREEAMRGWLGEAGLTDQGAFEVVAADLLSDAGWPEAMEGVDGVLHVASPVAPGHVEDEDAVIRPAREGALRVLRAADDAGVRRVVLTSAFHAVA